jgi:hypothetical protein
LRSNHRFAVEIQKFRLSIVVIMLRAVNNRHCHGIKYGIVKT